MVIIFAPVLRLEITQKFYHEEAILSKDFVICLTLGTGVVGGIIGAATLASHPEFGD